LRYIFHRGATDTAQARVNYLSCVLSLESS